MTSLAIDDAGFSRLSGKVVVITGGSAGISGRALYLDATVRDGKLIEPEHATLDVNLKAVANTAYLALYYFKHQDPIGGCLLLNASAAVYQRFRIVDYAMAKHGVVGLTRALHSAVTAAKLDVRVNAVAPNWTVTGMVPEGVIESTGHRTQSADTVARSAVFLMADPNRRGDAILSEQGRFWDVEKSLLEIINKLGGLDEVEEIMDGIERLSKEAGAATGSLPGSKS